MRRTATLDRSIDLLSTWSALPSSSASLCRTCLAQRAAVRISPTQATPLSTTARHRASDEPKSSFTERWRKRLWNTEKSPEPADPYNKTNATDLRIPESVAEDEESLQLKTKVEMEMERKKARWAKYVAKQKKRDEAYEPATKWDGLESIGWTRKEVRNRLDPRDAFKGFLPSTRTTSPSEVTLSLYRAVVEAYTLLEESLPLSTLSSDAPDNRNRYQTSSVRIETFGRVSNPVLHYPDDQTRQDVLAALHQNKPTDEEQAIQGEDGGAEAASTLRTGIYEPSSVQKAGEAEAEPNLLPGKDATGIAQQADLAEAEPSMLAGTHEAGIAQQTDEADSESAMLPEEDEADLAEGVARLGQAWLNISLEDPAVKFAIVKRTTQLTGIVLPDPSLPYIGTTGSLLTALLDVVAPKPQTTYEALVADAALKGLPNIKIVGRRVTPVDREKEVGRWKGIVRELEKRELPVLGHRHLL